MNDDEYGTQLLSPLRVAPGGPPRIDVPKAMRDGRRMRNRRWLFDGGLFATIAAALVTGSLLVAPGQDRKPVLPPDPPLPTACTLANLPMGKYKSAELAGGDSTGRWQFGLSNPVVNTGPQRLLIWHDGRLTAEAEIPGIELTMADMNSSGVVVGDGHSLTRDSSNFRPYVYHDGKLSVLKGGLGRAVAINDDGVIVGRLEEGGREVAVRWRSPDAEPERLPMPPRGVQSDAYAIAPDGTIAGRVGYVEPGAQYDGRSGRQVGNGYLWLPDGSVRELEAPPSDDPLATVKPIAFRFGWLYADQIPAPRTDQGIGASASRLYRYDPGSDTWQKLAEGTRPFVQIPGPGRNSEYEGLSATPQVFVGPRTLDLPMTAPIAGSDDSALVGAISDDAHVLTGWIVKGNEDLTKPFRPVIWRCR